MPTGYTADIAKGITFKEFALNCARAFGALVHMRDESSDAPIPDVVEPSKYHAEKLVGLREDLKYWSAISDADAEVEASREFEKTESYRLTRINELLDLKEKYCLMMNEVNQWQAPDEHLKLKAFMVEQIESSINWDCDTTYYLAPTEKFSGHDFKLKKLKEISKSIAYHSEEDLKEICSSKDKTDWIQKLKASL